MTTGRASWPPGLMPPDPAGRHVQTPGLPGLVLKAKGKRPWRIVGKAGTFVTDPNGVAVDAMEAAFRDYLKLLHHKAVRNPASAKKGGQARRDAAKPLHDKIAKLKAGLSPKITKSGRAKAILRMLGVQTSERTVRRVLRELDRQQ